MFNPDGSVDLGNTMAVNAYPRNPPIGMAAVRQQQELGQRAARDATLKATWLTLARWNLPEWETQWVLSRGRRGTDSAANGICEAIA